MPMHFRGSALSVALALTLCVPGAVRAQVADDQPFLFTTLPLSGQTGSAMLASLDAGYAERSFSAVAPERLEMRAALQSPLSRRLSVLASGGIVPGGEDSGATVAAELMMDMFGRNPGALALGIGGMRDYDGTSVAMAHLVAARRGIGWQVAGNIRLERPFAAERDEVDVLTSLGYRHRLGSSAAIGIEGVGEDLEGLFDTEEAEGGAKVMLGPTLSLAAPQSRWVMLVGAGPILYVNRNSRASSAVRDLNTDSGFVLRLSVRHR